MGDTGHNKLTTDFVTLIYMINFHCYDIYDNHDNMAFPLGPTGGNVQKF